MTAPSVEYGATSTVSFATLAAPTTKFKFMIRDDARTKSGAVFGRTIRLGDPVSLGPNSTWKQTSWVGGVDQDIWRDAEMCKDATCDIYSEPGKAKLHRGLGEIYTGTARLPVTRIAMGRNASDANRATPISLLMGEDGQNLAGTSPSGGYRLYGKFPGASATLIKNNFDAGIKAFSPVDDGSSAVYIGLDNGKVYVTAWNGTTWDAPTLVYTDTLGGIAENSMVAYGGSLFWLAGGGMRKRTNDLVNPITYTEIGPIAGSIKARGICVWNNRIWFGSMTAGRQTRIHVSDGVTVTQAFAFPEEFEVEGLIPYNGGLYIYGARVGADRVSFVGQIWRYTGSTLTRVWEHGTGEDHEDHTIYDAMVYKGVLYWTRQGEASNGYRYGFMAYDSQLDSVYVGPTESVGSVTYVKSIDAYNQTLVMSCVYFDATTAVRPIAELGAVKRTTADLEQYILSSRFDGEVPGEQKVWLNARVRAKLAEASTEIAVYVILDEGSEQLISTIAYDASSLGWRNVTIPLKVGGDYLRSTTIQYKLYLRNKHASAGSTRNPMIDSVEIDYFVSPAKRRQWSLRILASEAQGTDAAMTTAQSIEDKVELFWGSQKPFLFWDRNMNPSTDTGIEVMPTTFNSAMSLLESGATDLQGEIGFSFYEVV